MGRKAELAKANMTARKTELRSMRIHRFCEDLGLDLTTAMKVAMGTLSTQFVHDAVEIIENEFQTQHM